MINPFSQPSNNTALSIQYKLPINFTVYELMRREKLKIEIK